MSALSGIVLVCIIMIAGGASGAFLAGAKNRDISFWTAWGFIFPPSVLVLVMLSRNKGPRPRRPSLDEEDRMHL